MKRMLVVLLVISLLLPSLLLPSFANASPAGVLGQVVLITGSELEIEYDEPILSDAEAKATFELYVDGVKLGNEDWIYLSYFDFGPYATRGGVVNVRIVKRIDDISTAENPGADIGQALDAGRPREQRRTNARFNDTQTTRGPLAAARVQVGLVGGSAKTASWKAFYEEVNQGYMSMFYTWVAAGAGKDSTNSFSATNQQYNTQYLAQQMSEGTNSFSGRSEYLNVTAFIAGFQFHVLGGTQSVYEAPAWRELYVYGVTNDTYTRAGIGGSTAKPIIVTTADQVMRHDSQVKNPDGSAARPRSDFFQFGEDFFRLYYIFGVLEGSTYFPLGQFNDWDEYRYDVWLERAYDKAVAAGKWPGSIMMDMNLPKAERLEHYYVFGALAFMEEVDESATWGYTRFPINTRYEIYEYDYDLYRVLCGVHGRYLYFCGPGTGSFTNDSMKNYHPWYWRSQPDNYTVDAAGQAVARPPLAIKEARIISNNQLLITFNRPIKTITNACTAGNWRIYRNGTAVTTTGMTGGYAWETVTLTSSTTLDNGVPYGRSFRGFKQSDIDERKISAGGWISNTQSAPSTALERGEFVGLDDAIARGAGPNGTITVAYIGANDVTDWSGNVLPKNVQSEAIFKPWEGNAYRSALTGVYVYGDTEVEESTLMAAAHMYETTLLNNATVTYPMQASQQSEFHQPGYTNGTTAITYSNTGQRVADGSVYRNGGNAIMAGEVYGHHAAMQPGMKSQIGSSFHTTAYVEGWGGTIFQSDEVLVKKDTMLSRYKNENLVLHEGGHGWDSNSSTYASYAKTDINNAYSTTTNINNGRRYYDQYGSYTYPSSNSAENFATLMTYWAGAMREQYAGISDGTWTPINSREEFFRYDPYGYEAYKRSLFNGDLGMWYHDKYGNKRVGDPDYRVLPSDWELLADTYDEFAGWKENGRGVNNLIAWGSSIHEVARSNPYTNKANGLPEDTINNPLVNWISWNTPNVWDLEYVQDPYLATNMFDFVQKAYNPADPSPTVNQPHPFFRPEGVIRPNRPAELLALVTPVEGQISNITLVGGVLANLVQFEFTGYDADITMDNAPTSFEVYINGDLSYFTFWKFQETAPGEAIVQLRLEWPVDMIGTDVEVGLRPVGAEATPSAFVTKLNGNKNDLTISIVEELSYGQINVYTQTFSINNNAAGSYQVGPYLVYVDTKGNDQIRACYIV
ncbi:MAG: hypothetical protein FWH55_03805 [Oscillospiraceae bacterium]|nr:hypothetical protein [Oscillospiraceae bacterium]